jgi:hypothetical protein
MRLALAVSAVLATACPSSSPVLRLAHPARTGKVAPNGAEMRYPEAEHKLGTRPGARTERAQLATVEAGRLCFQIATLTDDATAAATDLRTWQPALVLSGAQEETLAPGSSEISIERLDDQPFDVSGQVFERRQVGTKQECEVSTGGDISQCPAGYLRTVPAYDSVAVPTTFHLRTVTYLACFGPARSWGPAVKTLELRFDPVVKPSMTPIRFRWELE